MGTVNHTTRVRAVEKTKPRQKELWPVPVLYRFLLLLGLVRKTVSFASEDINNEEKRKVTLPYPMLYLLINTASGSGFGPSSTNSTSPLPATCVRPAPLLHLQGTEGVYQDIPGEGPNCRF